MELFGVFVALQIIRAYSASRLLVHDDNVHLEIAATDIIDTCFGSSERWSELLIIPDRTSDGLLKNVHHELKTSNSILFLNCERNDKLTQLKRPVDTLTNIFEFQDTKTTAIIIFTHSSQHLECVLYSLKNNIQRLWRPGAYFVVISDTRCDVAELNNMFKVIWDYWILNAVILCSSKNLANVNQNKIDLYTFNPYSAIHSPQWKTVIYETVEVSIDPGNFNHSWYIFKQRFTEIVSAENCGDIFFDKTSNLDGYSIPVSLTSSSFSTKTNNSWLPTWFAVDGCTLTALAKKLRFHVAQVTKNGAKDFGPLLINGSYVGLMDYLYRGRSHIAPTKRGVRFYPGLEMTYPHDVSGACFASWIVGNRPQWTNLADAKHIWIALGLGLLFSTVVLYLQNKSRGIVSAFLDAQRLIIGNTIMSSSTVIKRRIILGSIFLVVLVVDGVIKGRFISILTVAKPYPYLDTIEQIKEQNVAVYGHAVFEEMIADPQVAARLDSSLAFPKCLNSPRRREYQRACFADCLFLRFFTINSSDIHRAPSPVWTSYVTFLTTMHWPMTDRYSFEVQKLVEAGILEKWKFDVDRKLEVDSWKLKRAAEPAFVKPMELNLLLPVFGLLFGGVSVALIIFVWEVKGGCFIKS